VHDRKVPLYSHSILFELYLRAITDAVRYLVIPRIFGLKFHFTLRDGLSAWIAYTHKNLLSLASGVEKENGHICYCLQFLQLQDVKVLNSMFLA
jgi:hypothetical protein